MESENGRIRLKNAGPGKNRRLPDGAADAADFGNCFFLP